MKRKILISLLIGIVLSLYIFGEELKYVIRFHTHVDFDYINALFVFLLSIIGISSTCLFIDFPIKYRKMYRLNIWKFLISLVLAIVFTTIIFIHNTPKFLGSCLFIGIPAMIIYFIATATATFGALFMLIFLLSRIKKNLFITIFSFIVSLILSFLLLYYRVFAIFNIRSMIKSCHLYELILAIVLVLDVFIPIFLICYLLLYFDRKKTLNNSAM